MKGLQILKQQGNDFFKAKKYSQAKAKFLSVSDTIAASHKQQIQNVKSEIRTLYINVLTNSALCSLNLKTQAEYMLAIDYCNTVLDLDPQNLKGLYRRGLAFKQLGELQELSGHVDNKSLLNSYKKSKQDFQKLTLLDRKNQIAEQKLSETIKNFYRIKLLMKQELNPKVIQKAKNLAQPEKVPQKIQKSNAMTKIMEQYKVEEVTKIAHKKIQEGLLINQLPKTRSQLQRAIKTIQKSKQIFYKFTLRFNKEYLIKIDPTFDLLHKIFMNLTQVDIKSQQFEGVYNTLQALFNCKAYKLFWTSLLPKQKSKIQQKIKLAVTQSQYTEINSLYFV